MSYIVVTFVLHSALRRVLPRTQATYQPIMRSPGGGWQTAGCVPQIGLAESGCTFRVCLPCCLEQQLRAGGPFCERKGDTLSDKELHPEVDDPVENGLSPGGCPAKLCQHHWRHPFLKSLQIETLSLSIYARHLVSSSRRSSLTTVRSGLTV